MKEEKQVSEKIKNDVQEYYGKDLKNSNDLKTSACTTISTMPRYIKDLIGNIHDEVVIKYYGCGLAVPSELKDLKVLDLGCGAGRDVYLLSQLVGESGKVVGIDMTDEQLQVAKNHSEYHAKKFNYKKSNVEFIKGDLEQLDKLDLEPGTFDLIVSNCVINLVPNKEKVLKDCYSLLKPGGEIYFSDVYCDRRVDPELKNDKVLHGECLSGALYWNDFLRLSRKAGFIDPRLVESGEITITDEKIKEKLPNLRFFSATYRLFKIDTLESDCEDYGEAVMYKGTISESPNSFLLDGHHLFETGAVMSVCSNTYDMLYKTRFRKHFEFYGTRKVHRGIFQGCGKNLPFTTNSISSQDCSTGACC